MPGGGKKAVFPTLALRDNNRGSHEHHSKKLAHQPRSKSESKEIPEKEKPESSNTKHQKQKTKAEK